MEEYLTESNLINYLNLIYPNEEWIHDKRFKNYRFRPDYVSHNLRIVVEFDGYQHYTSCRNILNDYRKNEIIEKEGYIIIRVPYFVQLDKQVISNLFKREINIVNDFPHGFISDKKTLILPCDFCELGVERFKNDLYKFHYIKDAILKSLKRKIDKLGDKNLVYPPSLSYIFE